MNDPIRSTQSPGKAIEVSVVIPALNVATTIGQQLDSLGCQDFDGDWEVIVADNGSTDSTREVVESFADRFPSLRIVDASDRRGINHARNQGARAARGSLILFCDGDDVVVPTWITAMTEALKTCDAVGGRIQRTTFEDSSNASAGTLVLVDPIGGGSKFLPHPIGANCGVKRAVWLELGGFDENYDGGAADEIEFFWRLQIANYSLGGAPDAIVHYRSPTKRKLKKTFRAGREQVRLYRDFREYGYRGPSADPLRAWAWILITAPLAAASKHHRNRWLVTVARRLGRIAGSLKYRQFVL